MAKHALVSVLTLSNDATVTLKRITAESDTRFTIAVEPSPAYIGGDELRELQRAIDMVLECGKSPC